MQKKKSIGFILLFYSLIFSLILFTNIPKSTANQLNVLDYDQAGILHDSIQYYAIYNNAEDTEMTVNLTALEFIGSTGYPEFALTIFDWEDYFPNKENGIVKNFSITYYCEVQFTCKYRNRYLVRVENIDQEDDAIYNISFITKPGVAFSEYGNLEQLIEENQVSVSYYFDSDPWLYDSYNSENRTVLMIGYDLYFEFTTISSNGERWFLINNYYGDITMFVGVTAYNINPNRDTPMVTLAVYDWESLEGGAEDSALATTFTILNHSCGFNFTCRKDHVYNVWLKNDDSAWFIFTNVSFYTNEQANIRLDHDLDPDPPDDQIKVRIFDYDPWLEFKNMQRQILWWWILGGGGIIGLGILIIWLKFRYT